MAAVGVGSALLAALIDTGERWLGLNRLQVSVFTDNHRAIALYRRFGFVPVGVRKGYYADTGEDALVMWAYEVDTPAYAQLLNGVEGRIPGTTVYERPKSW